MGGKGAECGQERGKMRAGWERNVGGHKASAARQDIGAQSRPAERY